MATEASTQAPGSRLGAEGIEGADATHEQWQTAASRIGQAGLVLNRSLDALTPQELSRMNNLYHTGDGRLTSRFGQSSYATTAGTEVHSIGRLNDPRQGNHQHIWGVDSVLYRGLSGPLAQIDAGYSGNPVTMMPHRPNLSSSPWMVVADSSKMSIVPLAGSALPLGLPAPTVVANPTVAAKVTKTIISFNTSDNTSSGSWTPNPGQDRSSPPVQTGNAGTKEDTGIDPTNPGTTGVGFITAPGAAKTGYSTWWNCPLGALDLTQLPGGVPATDNDIIHVWIQVNNGISLEEVRIYLVCSDAFDATILPGSGVIPVGAAAGANKDAFVKSFAQADLQAYISQRVGGQQSAQNVAAAQARRTFLSQQRQQQIRETADGNTILQSNPFDPTTVEPPTLDPGGTATEFGTIGLPIRRSDFIRIGNTPGKGWQKITGAVIFIQTVDTTAVEVAFQTMYLTGGFGPDTSDPTLQPYDYRYTYYDPRTGFESNPSPIMATANYVNALRQKVNLVPGAAHPDSAVLERWYRRGGINVTNWYFLGTSATHGGTFADTATDLTASTSGTLAINHDQAVTTVDANGTTVLAQPLPAIWGPTDSGFVFACGDPYRPGFLYWCIPGQVGHWPAANTVEVCSPSEQLMNGCNWGGQAYVFSKERLYVVYPNFDGTGAVRANPTACINGLITISGLAVTPYGMAYISRDGVRLTQGGGSELVGDNIRPLFHGLAVNGFQPVDFSKPTDMRLVYFDNELWFIYRDTAGVMQCMVLHLLYKYWRPYSFGKAISTAYNDTGPNLRLILGGKTTGKAYTHIDTSATPAFTDDGTAIAWSCRTGAYDGGQLRQEKQWGDIFVDIDLQGQAMAAQTFLNAEAITNPSQSVQGIVGRRRYIFDCFGTTPQKGRSLSIDLSGVAPATGQVVLEYVGASVLLQPDVTIQRVTNWDALGSATEKYCYGIQLEVDTFGGTVPFVVEYTQQNGLTGVANVQSAGSFSASTTGRHKLRFTWSAQHGDLWRIRPNGACQAWTIYRADWLAQSEPPRIAGWDTNWENKGDSYATGVTIECDTFGQNKTVQVQVRDGTQPDPVIQTFTVNTNGRHLVYLPLNISTPVRGALYRLLATDANFGLLYSWEWWTQPEPGEMANWNQNYTTAGTMGDKFLKGLIIQADTFGAAKTINIEVDGVVQGSIVANHLGRTTNQYSFPQILGRVFRLLPTDTTLPSRLYELQWIFDSEPLALSRWETQETDHLLHGWQSVLWANFTLKTLNAVDNVTLTVTIYGNSGVAQGAAQVYTLPATNGLKQKLYVPFRANKGALYKYVFTCASAFWLYREESEMMIKPWGGDEPLLKRPWGNDDLSAAREMGKASLAAAHQGGALGSAE